MQFKVTIWEEQSGDFVVEAKDQQEAESLMLARVEEVGIDELAKDFNFEVKHRNVEVIK